MTNASQQRDYAAECYGLFCWHLFYFSTEGWILEMVWQ